MTTEEKISPPQKRAIMPSPWLIVLGALLLYGFTLNHWVTLNSLPVISRVTGWDWHPNPLPWRQTPVAPLFFVLTCPFRLLPVAWQPAALNAFAAFCAALTLGLLAASVRLLPHDRTREQRQREGGEFSLLSLPAAFLPVLFAVLMLGLQLTFWQSAIAASGDMLDLLVFACLIFCLLKFRISQNDNWLSGFTFLYGLGVANDWALLGFFPFFLIALIWIKGVNFFNWRFLARLAGCGFLGLLLYLLLPALGSLGAERGNFLTLLHLEVVVQRFTLRLVPRWIVLVAALPTLLPLFFAGIRWPSFEGEVSAAGSNLTRLMFRLLHVVFLLLALIMFFNFKYSPSLRLQEEPVGFLTFYYMGALCVGYYSGYILLVFGKSAAQAWEKRGALIRAFNLLVVGLLWLLAVAAPCGLFYGNIPRINASKSNVLADYSREVIRELPAKPIIILSDDPVRLYLLEAAFRREGKPNKNILIETASLTHREYIAYLVSRYPDLKKETVSPLKLPYVLPTDALVKYLYGLSRMHSIYYLSPSFGYYFEAFYLKPHGLVYELQLYPKNAVEAPLPASEEIKENEDIWDKIGKKSLATLPSLAKLDPDAAAIAVSYSVGLDFWGVALQKAGHLKEANARFAEAARINPENFIAKINKEYNERLQKNDHRPIDSGDLVYKAVNVYRGMVPILKYNGPVDEPEMNLIFGTLMADGHDLRQSAGMFERRLQLLPGDVNAELDLAKVFVDSGQVDKAMELVRKLHANPAAGKWEVSRVEALAYFAKNDFPTAEMLMQDALREDPHDEKRVAILAEFYRVTAYTALRQANDALRQASVAASQKNEVLRQKNEAVRQQAMNEATRRFKIALSYFDQALQLLIPVSQRATGPNSVPDILLKKAEMQMMLRSFQPAISTLNQIMELEPGNSTALLNRAIAEMQLNQLQAAKEDYKTLRKLLPFQPYVVDYGLAEIAARQKHPEEEIRCLKRYLDSAPDDLPEYQQVKLQLRKLESH
jgi:tetratricopeptide (TPR) repeat protein